jgi:hypothetical protein
VGVHQAVTSVNLGATFFGSCSRLQASRDLLSAFSKASPALKSRQQLLASVVGNARSRGGSQTGYFAANSRSVIVAMYALSLSLFLRRALNFVDSSIIDRAIDRMPAILQLI